MTKKDFFDLALSFQGTESCPHFERIGFKITQKRMFATYLQKDNTANIFLTPQEQQLFCKMDKGIFPVPNKWGEKGATTFLLDKVSKEIVQEALLSAYNDVLKPKK
ncbi:MAG: MmcQ/YjbR family DNA-binding protein [Chitinophagaceae bacterium]